MKRLLLFLSCVMLWASFVQALDLRPTLSPWTEDGTNVYMRVQRNMCVGVGPTATDALSLCTAPVASATRVLLNLSNTALSGGSVNGTYLGANPAACTGDFFNFQVADTSKASLTCAGALVAASISGALTLTNAHIFVGNVSNVATDVVVSGDLTLANTGAFSIGALKVTNAMLAGSIDLTTKVTGLLPAANFPALTGHITTVAGTLATTLGSFTSAQLKTALTNATGSGGGAVFATGPTLASPIIANIAPGADFTVTQNSVVPFTSVNAGATVNTLYVAAGTVGINTTDQADKLHVVGAKNSSTNPSTGGILVSDSTSMAAGVGGAISFRGNYTGTTETIAATIHAAKSNGTDAQFGFDLVFHTRVNGGNNTEKMRISTTGNIGMNNSNPTFGLDAVGTMRFQSLTAAIATNSSVCIIAATKEIVENAASSCLVSSLRFKDDVVSMGEALHTLLALRPVSYRFKNTSTSRLGFIAEDVYAIEPRFVDLDEDNLPHSVRYAEMTSLLVKGFHELEARIVLLEKEGHQ